MSPTNESETSFFTGESDESEDDHRELILSAERLYRSVRNKRKRAESRVDTRKIQKVVIQTLNDIIDSITAGKIMYISQKFNPL